MDGSGVNLTPIAASLIVPFHIAVHIGVLVAKAATLNFFGRLNSQDFMIGIELKLSVLSAQLFTVQSSYIFRLYSSHGIIS